MQLPDLIKNTKVNKALDTSKSRTLKQTEAIMIEQALKRNKGNKTATAKQLGIDKSTLFRKMKAFGITDKNG